MLNVAKCKTALPNATTVRFSGPLTIGRLADPCLGKKLKASVARAAAARDRSVAQRGPLKPADETVPDSQHASPCRKRATPSPQQIAHTSNPPPSSLRSAPASVMSIDTTLTQLESLSVVCPTPIFSDSYTNYLGFPLLPRHRQCLCENSSPFRAGYAAMAGCCCSALE